MQSARKILIDWRSFIVATLLIALPFAISTNSTANSNEIATDLLPPEISIGGIHSPTWSAEGAQLICSVRVENPNPVDLPVTGADIKLKLANTPAARGRLPSAVTVPARGVRQVDVLVNVSMNAAVTWLPMFLGTSEFTMPYDVAGFVDVDHPDLGRVPFHETGDVSMTGDGIQVHAANK